MTTEEIKEMDKCITALRYELPASIIDDVESRWNKVKEAIAAQQTPAALPDDWIDKMEDAADEYANGDKGSPNYERRLIRIAAFISGAKWLQSNLSTPTGEGEAVAFARWIKVAGFEPCIDADDKWLYDAFDSVAYYTTEELYKLFKQQP